MPLLVLYFSKLHPSSFYRMETVISLKAKIFDKGLFIGKTGKELIIFLEFLAGEAKHRSKLQSSCLKVISPEVM